MLHLTGLFKPMPIAALLTLLWFCLLGWLTIHVQECNPLLPLSRFAERFLGCLSPNELGDYVAGAFAPVAFLWFAATVFMQSRELSEQRDELRLARTVAEEQSRAASAQAEEARAQTTLLLRAADRSQREEAGRELEAELQEFLDECRSGSLSRIYFFDRNNGYRKEIALDSYSDISMSSSFRSISKMLTHVTEEGGFEPEYEALAEHYVERLRDIAERAPNTTASMQAKLAALPLERIARALSNWGQWVEPAHE